VLSQFGHPLAYFSKGLSTTNQKLSTYEKEFLVVLMAVDKWRSYLHKNPFIIRTYVTFKIRPCLLICKEKQ
jgi:hypothetical protein